MENEYAPLKAENFALGGGGDSNACGDRCKTMVWSDSKHGALLEEKDSIRMT
jgi:hypothetical protein